MYHNTPDSGYLKCPQMSVPVMFLILYCCKSSKVSFVSLIFPVPIKNCAYVYLVNNKLTLSLLLNVHQ